MKSIKILAVLLLFSATVSTLFADGKRYHVKSGIIEYQIDGGGSFLGMGSKTTGTQKIIFKDWGNVELNEEKSTSTTMGKTDTTHTMLKIDHGQVYSVDFERKIIIKQDSAMLKQMQGKDMSKMGKDMLESMGGKKVGNGKVLGYNCEIWELMGSKSWLYKGVPLKTESSMMGMKHNSIATKAKFNVSISDNDLKLPNFPLKTMEQLMQSEMDNNAQKNINTHKSKKEESQMPQDLQQIKGMMKNLGGLFGQ
jgi:hypothetical protein